MGYFTALFAALGIFMLFQKRYDLAILCSILSVLTGVGMLLAR